VYIYLISVSKWDFLNCG